MTGSPNAVFVSYASEDAAVAERICAALRAAGVEIWFDQNELRGGDAWDRQIRQQIHECALFIAVISAHSDARDEGYFRREWRLAVERTHDLADDTPFLVPVAIDATAETRARVPDQFRYVQWTHLPPGDVPSAFVDRVKSLIERKRPSPAAAPPQLADGGGAVAPMATTVHSAVRPAVRRTTRTGLAIAALALAVVGTAFYLRFAHPVEATPGGAVEKSIAVLPFLDMSEKRDQEYFSDGLTEELIDHLANTPNLRVIARTSSFQFKGRNEDVRTIAGKLGVANVLEGSVRRSGNELRVTAQLIRAADGTHLWSRTYDRSLSDVFKLQDEIATMVSSALQVALNPASRTRATGTTNLEAYNLLLKGNYYFARGSVGDDGEAVRYYVEALRLDPDYAQAWARLARTYIWQSVAGELPPAEAAAKARQAAQRALAIDPGCALAHYALGNIHRFYDYDWKAAIDEFERVQALDPNSDEGANARNNIFLIKMYRTGRTDEAIGSVLEYLVRNPLDTTNISDLAWVQQIAGQLSEAAATSRRLLQLNANYATGQWQYAYTLLLMGNTTEALAAAGREPDQASRLSMLACVHWTLGHRAESTAAIGELEAGFAGTSAYLIATSHACRGEADAAMAWLERAYRQREGSMPSARVEQMFLKLHSNPRYQALLVKMNLAD